ncbi:hypothetical protein JTE90_017228 [Oedothorax gibbosus]|uniref:Integrase catalytic domain-containing protein n=1 Tax=Oedothorax gibbosus TaxID=931172 RepID=A0AAV6VDM0_9ARAC|nr:hypothetical protein JTE90_017228 [Oedothorax gibbosus]
MFILDTDASKEGIGAVLSQEVDGKERVIAYFSKSLVKTREELLRHEKRAPGDSQSRRTFSPLFVWETVSSKGPNTRTRGRLQRYNVGAPFERIAIDVLGLFRRQQMATSTSYSHGLFYEVARSLCHSKPRSHYRCRGLLQAWQLDMPVRSASLAALRPRNELHLRVFTGLMELLGVTKTRTTPLHPQSDGMVERLNRTILNHLSLFTHRNQNDWDQKLPLFSLAYRSAVHETTGLSPSQMLMGRELRLPCDLLFGRPPDDPSSPVEYLEDLKARLEDVHLFARERIDINTSRMKTRYDAKSHEPAFKIATRSGFGIRSVVKVFLQSCRPSGKDPIPWSNS